MAKTAHGIAGLIARLLRSKAVQTPPVDTVRTKARTADHRGAENDLEREWFMCLASFRAASWLALRAF
jgi:hypothetical protein